MQFLNKWINERLRKFLVCLFDYNLIESVFPLLVMVFTYKCMSAFKTRFLSCVEIVLDSDIVPTFESLGIETSFLVCKYVCRISRSGLYQCDLS